MSKTDCWERIHPMLDINPFLVDYDQKENKITALLMHVLEQRNCMSRFLTTAFEGIHTFQDSEFECGLQLQQDFVAPVKNGFVLGISNNGDIEEDISATESGEGVPDASIYDKNHQVLVLIESKVERGQVTRGQLLRHQHKVKSNVAQWQEPIVIRWEDVLRFFHQRSVEAMSNPLERYILGNFIDVLRRNVISPSNYDEEAFLSVAQRCEVYSQVKALMTQLKTYEGWYIKQVSTREIRYHCESNRGRFATFVLGNRPRFILHPGKPNGLNWRREIQETYGVWYIQGSAEDDYSVEPDELSIPLKDIDAKRLRIQSDNSIPDNEWADMTWLISQTIHVNRLLKGKIRKAQ